MITLKEGISSQENMQVLENLTRVILSETAADIVSIKRRYLEKSFNFRFAEFKLLYHFSTSISHSIVLRTPSANDISALNPVSFSVSEQS